MNAPLTAQPTNGMGKNDHEKHAQPNALRIPAKIISYIFHPIFIPVYILIFLMRVQPYLFVSVVGLKKTFTIIQFGVMYAFFPVVTALLLKALGFIDSVYMKTQKDRIIPYVICMIYYFWVWHVIRNQNIYPAELVQFSLAIFITSILGLMSNSYMKVSMHAMAVGVMAAFVVVLSIAGNIDSGIYISAALFITGLVCTARLIVSDHTGKEIYTGLFIGIIALLLAKFSFHFFNA